MTVATTEAPAIGSPLPGRRGAYLRAAFGVAAVAVFARALTAFTHAGAVPQVHYWWLMMVAPAYITSQGEPIQ